MFELERRESLRAIENVAANCMPAAAPQVAWPPPTPKADHLGIRSHQPTSPRYMQNAAHGKNGAMLHSTDTGQGFGAWQEWAPLLQPASDCIMSCRRLCLRLAVQRVF